MEGRRFIFAGASVVVAIAIGYVVGTKKNEDETKGWVVRSYQVPPARAEEIKSALNRVFWVKNDESAGAAQVFGSGLMLVRAPMGIQTGVASLIDQLTAEKQTKRTSVRMDYWLVVGSEEKTSNATSLPSIQKALEGISEVDGARNYRVIEHLSSNSNSGQEIEIQGSRSKVKTQVNNRDDGYTLRLEYQSDLGKVKTDTQLNAGEFLVLGQNAVDEKVPADRKFPPGTNVYYIVRAQTK